MNRNKNGPLPLHPFPFPNGEGEQTNEEEPGYILILQDECRKVTFLNCLTGKQSFPMQDEPEVGACFQYKMSLER
jgi:hypothetical protein